MRPRGWQRSISMRVLQMRSGELQSAQTPVLAQGVRKPGWRAMLRGAAMSRMRCSASSRL